METPTILCLLVAVIFFLRAESHGTGCQFNKNIRTLRKILKTDTKAFQREAWKLRGKNAPCLEDLTAMFIDLSSGNIPQFIEENGYTSIANATVSFSYTNTNAGETNTTIFGLFQTDGVTDAFSSLEFTFIDGDVGDFSYEAGTSFFTQVFYTKGEKYVNFQASVLGSLVFKYNGRYFSNGNFTGISQGNLMEFDEVVMEEVKTLGILHTTEYYSLNELTTTGRAEGSSYTSTLDMVSMTGGTNGTIETSINTDDDTVIISGNGILRNANNNAAIETKGVFLGSFDIDYSNPFSEATLSHFFMAPRAGADIYLP